jgi:glucose 1-dehydrogenase
MLQRPNHRLAWETEDIANLVVWLASDESDYIHGETIVMDGGMTLYPSFKENG